MAVADARTERLLARHDDIVAAEHVSGRPALYRRDQVLVLARDAAHVDDRMRQYVDRREDHDDIGVATFRLRPTAGGNVASLISDVADTTSHRTVAMAPNHVLRGEPVYSGGPFDQPVPVTDVPAPRPGGAARRRVTVAVLDTGISPHPWYDASPWFADCGADEREVLDADLDLVLDSEAGHGTFIAGLVLQAAPDASIVVRRVLASDGVCDELDLVRHLTALAAAASVNQRGVDVVNLSLGGYTYDDRPSPVVSAALARFGRETVVVAAAGNNASDRPFWPAALKRVVAVAALDQAGSDRAAFSNYGWWVDASAPGEHAASSFVTFDETTAPAGVKPEDFQGFATWSGTSFAAPRVSGAIAALMAAEDLSASAAAASLLDPHAAASLPDLGVVVGGAAGTSA